MKTMGTNYYAKLNRCKECGREDVIHIGKSSSGWKFSFQYNGGKFYKNVEEMKEWLKNKYIENEYGEKIDELTLLENKILYQFTQFSKHYTREYWFFAPKIGLKWARDHLLSSIHYKRWLFLVNLDDQTIQEL